MPIRHWLKLTEPRPICGKLRSVTSQERTPRLAKACAVGRSPGWCGDLYSSKQSTSCVTARFMEWALSRLILARHWAQYAVRHGATASSVTNFSTAILSIRQGHQVTEDSQNEDLIKLREGGLLLLDKLKQITLAWVSFWKNVVSGQGEEEHFQQMEEAQLEEAEMSPLVNVLT